MKYSWVTKIIRSRKFIIIIILLFIAIVINIFYLIFDYNNLGLLSKLIKMSRQEREIFGENNIPFYTTIQKVKNISEENDTLLLIVSKQYYEYYFYKINYFLYPLKINLLTFDTKLNVEILLSELTTIIDQSKKPTLVLIVNNKSYTDIFPRSDLKFNREFLPKIEKELTNYDLIFSHWDQFLYVPR